MHDRDQCHVYRRRQSLNKRPDGGRVTDLSRSLGLRLSGGAAGRLPLTCGSMRLCGALALPMASAQVNRPCAAGLNARPTGRFDRT